MRDLEIRLRHAPGALADMGEALGEAGVSVEGGGAWAVDGVATAHFLVADGAAARRALEARGIEVLADREVVAVRLDQGRPGQLGRLARAMGDAGVNLEVVYSDHDHRLILGVDDPERARGVAEAWAHRTPMSPEDQAYVRTHYCALPALCVPRALDPGEVLRDIEAGRLPRPSYVLPDGTAWFPADLFALLDEAGGLDALPRLFRDRFVAAAGPPVDEERVAAELAGYLSGEYGVCLRRVSPETIVDKESRVERITARIADPRLDDPEWAAGLRADVAALDQLTRPFAASDRIRFGGPVSRDRCVDAPRARWPAVFG